MKRVKTEFEKKSGLNSISGVELGFFKEFWDIKKDLNMYFLKIFGRAQNAVKSGIFEKEKFWKT